MMDFFKAETHQRFDIPGEPHHLRFSWKAKKGDRMAFVLKHPVSEADLAAALRRIADDIEANQSRR